MHKICSICLKDITESNASKYCFDCGVEVDKRYGKRMSSLKRNLRKIIVNEMIVECAAKSNDQQSLNTTSNHPTPDQHPSIHALNSSAPEQSPKKPLD